MGQSREKTRLRSREWFDDPNDPGATALHVERYTNFGITAQELRCGKPIIGIAQTIQLLNMYIQCILHGPRRGTSILPA